jgi:outer membrane protein assembly factor BamA
MQARTTMAVTLLLAAAGSPVHGQETPPASTAPASTTPAAALDGRPVREIRLPADLRAASVDIVRQHLASRVGAPFDPALLVEDRRRLDALRLFSRIDLQPTADGEGVRIDVDLKETLRLLPFLALSVTDENGVSAGPGFRGINLLGRGWLSSGTLQFGGATKAGVRFQRPSVTPQTWDLDTSVGYRSRRNELFEFDETSTTIAGRALRNVTSHVQVGGSAEFVWFDTGGADISLDPDGTDHLPAVGASFVYNSLDSQTNPHAGWLASVDAGRRFGDASSWTLTLDGRRVQPLTPRSTVSIVGFAAFQSGVVGEDLPAYLEVGLGGGNSVRGWSLGSRVGKQQTIGTLEYAYDIVPVRSFTVFGLNLYGGIQAAAFSDVGLAWNDHPAARDAIDGYGVGVRLLFPFVDVLRLDLAFGEPGTGAHLSFGIDLKADKQRDRVR